MDLKWLFFSVLFLLSSSSPLPSPANEYQPQPNAVGETKAWWIAMQKEPNTNAGRLQTYVRKGTTVRLVCMVSGEDLNGSTVWYQNFEWLCPWYGAWLIFCNKQPTPGWLHSKEIEVTDGVPPIGMSNCMQEV